MSNIDLKVNVRIETDEDIPDKIWIAMLDPVSGQEIEGGEFDADAFMDSVLKFYNSNY
jgi:hypothetical protein